MLTFYLIRHGMKDAIPFDPPLTLVGVKQAEITAEVLKGIDFQAGICSPKLRTKQTAEIIAKPHSFVLDQDDRLIERLEWENSESFDEFIVEWSKTDLDRDYQSSTGLSSHVNGKQVRQFFDELSNKYKEGTILVVTHGGTIGDLLRNLFGEANVPHEIDPVTNAPDIKISECSITVIKKEKEKYSLITLNDISHLVNL